MWVVGCRIPARGWQFLGVRRVVFGLGVVDDGVWWLWWRWTCVGGDRWSPLAGDGWRTVVTPDAGHWLPVRGRERVRASELEREKGLLVFSSL